MDLVEVNGRFTYSFTYMYRAMWPACEMYKAVVQLACGASKKIVQPPLGDGKVGGLFNVFTYGEGVAREFLDFRYLKEDCKRDGAITHSGPGMEVLVCEDTIIEQSASVGKLLVRFAMYDADYNTLVSKAKAVIGKMLLKPDLSPVI